MRTIFFLVIAVIFSCIFSKANADENEGTVDLGEIVHIFPIDEGTDRVFYQKIIPGYYQLMVQDFGKNPIEGQRVPTPYRVCDRYPEEDDKEDYYTDGFEFPIVYKFEPLSEGTSMSIIEEQWRPFETDLDWNGKRISKKKYGISPIFKNSFYNQDDYDWEEMWAKRGFFRCEDNYSDYPNYSY